MRITDTSDLWWKNAVIYCLDIETFCDSNGDGIGDFAGAAQRLDYLAELGVTCVWLMPFYPSPQRDDGYDVVDFYGVDERLGTLGDVVEFIRTAKDRGMRVIADLVVNHTSDEHPWFKQARSSKDNPYRDFYVWRSDPPPDTSSEVVFPDQENSIWTKDRKTGEWYLHRFYSHQPDLNVANPAVRDEIAKAMGFWMELGLSGFRVDAVPFFLETEGIDGHTGDPHDYLRDLRRFLLRRSGDAVLLGEVNLPFEQQIEFFGDAADELTMQFDFVTMQQMYLSLARGDARPLAHTLTDRPGIDPDSQWATFVRNHDELTLDKLLDSERQEVFEAFGPEKNMQVYDRGLKRRLPPMLDGDPQRIRMVYSLLFSLPGTPVLFYGEEIGMGENLAAEGRLAVRTPMQWTHEESAGFSSAPPGKLVRPLVEGKFAQDSVNVVDARRDPTSLLGFMGSLIRRYRECPELGWGSFSLIDTPNPAVLAHRCDWEENSLFLFHNFGAEPTEVSVKLKDGDVPDGGGILTDLLQDTMADIQAGDEMQVELPAYGYRWLRVQVPEVGRLW
ncbi:alpha-amylase family protein [Arthrobacter sp. CAN_C5]|uniref:alpha-amylase family protein n=1 Tax=Arthrobacter sp. CAN_C5 TaxID=2760706 RepID=UPI001AE61B27|nr:alpha-amylase family protein [Arthrobacter sp. CAN_C5]MBP2217234.1 trehalose synthase [Arthrobacter sp. CAN_C5]